MKRSTLVPNFSSPRVARLLTAGLLAGVMAALPLLDTPAQARQNRGGRGGSSSSARIRREFALVRASGVTGLKGKGRIEARRGREKVQVEVESYNLATWPVGSEFDVYYVTAATGPEGAFLGTVVLGQGGDDSRSAPAPLRRGRGGDDGPGDDRGGRSGDDDDDFGVEGELELKNWEGPGLPAGASPVTSITGFIVKSRGSGQVVLTSVAGRTR